MAKLFEYDESRIIERRRRSNGRAHRPHRVSTPVTPIPRRASVSSPGSARVRTRHPRTYTEVPEDDITCFPTIPRSATWQEEADEDELDPALPLLSESSPLLPSSPSIDELDTVPPVDECLHDRMFHISELVTKPPPVAMLPHSVLALSDEPAYIDDVVEADTVMDDTLIVVPSLPTDVALYETQVEDVVDVALAVRAKELLRRKGSVEDRPAFVRNPLDYIRWWLLSPGRLEFLFWLGGALLLGIIMCVVLVVTGLGLGFMSFGHMVH